jgi:hypothetical protein
MPQDIEEKIGIFPGADPCSASESFVEIPKTLKDVSTKGHVHRKAVHSHAKWEAVGSGARVQHFRGIRQSSAEELLKGLVNSVGGIFGAGNAHHAIDSGVGEGSYQVCEPVFSGLRVVVEENQDVSGSGVDSGIAGAADSAARLHRDSCLTAPGDFLHCS